VAVGNNYLIYIKGEERDMNIGHAFLLGQRIAVGRRAQLLSAAEEMLRLGGAISTVNPRILSLAARDAALASALRRSLNIPDGRGVAYALSRRGIVTDTLPGVELGEELLASGEEIRLAIIGGAPGVAREAMARLRLKYRGVSEAFVCDGYSYTEQALGMSLERERPGLVFVCLGTPKQELLIDTLRPYAPWALFIGLGGSADVYSGRTKRAPAPIRALGAEWLFRMIREPKRFMHLGDIGNFLRLSRQERKKLFQNR
jgi:N-acetylglucosaminyldiphosphoundecaprenol N-acetyl-beta-D-mannosaminyltransferase